jgi:dynein heavy chain
VWVHAIYIYANVAKEVAPKRQRLKEATDSLAIKQASLKEAQDALAVVCSAIFGIYAYHFLILNHF